MATVVEVRRLFGDAGDQQHDSWNYLVIFDSPTASTYEALTADDGTTSIPPDGTEYGTGTSVYSAASAEQDKEHPCIWNVKVAWSYQAQPDSKPTGGSKWNVKVSSRGHAYERPVYQGKKDGAGSLVAITNTAYFAFSRQPTVTCYDEDITISFNTTDGSIISAISDRRGKVNNDSVTFTYQGVSFTYDVGHLRLVDGGWEIDITKDDDGTPLTSWNVTLVFWHRPHDEHRDVEMMNTGFYDALGKRIKDAQGQPKTEESLLSATGFEITDGSTAVPLKWDVRDRIAMMTLLSGI